jgi:hypothetical protein
VLAINAQVGEVRSIAPIGQGAVVSMARTDGTLWAWFLHDDGRFEELGSPVEGGLARSPQGHVVVFATASGSSVGVVEDGGHTVTSVDVRGRSNGSFQAAAVIGEHCVAQRDCTIWLNDLGRTPAVLTARAGLAGTFVPRIQTLADVSSRGLRAGIVSRSDTGTCSEVQDGDGQQLWETCRVRLLSFSPDASRLLATSAYGDGLGDTELSVFDARTGHPQLDLRTTRGAVITQMVWEDDSHVLASVMQAGKAAVVRIGLDGRAEYAVPPVPQHGDANPFVLPVS